MAQACFAALILLSVPLFGEESSATVNDLACRAAAEGLPQVSAALLRTRIQQEADPTRRTELSGRLAALLVAGGRYEEALAVIAGTDYAKDPVISYWKAVALAGNGEPAAARDLLQKLLQDDSSIQAVGKDRILLAQARAIRGEGDPGAALALLDGIPTDSPMAEDALLERISDLLALGRFPDARILIESPRFTTSSGKATAAYLSALSAWRSGKPTEAFRLFSSVPPATPWIASAAALGAGLSSKGQIGAQQAVLLLEKRLEGVDDAPLLEEQFLLLERLQNSQPGGGASLFKKWAADASRPTRAKFAAFHEAKGELARRHDEQAGILLEKFLASYPDDSLSDRARLLLSASLLRRGLSEKALGAASDRPPAPLSLRARLAYVRGLAKASLGDASGAIEDFQTASSLDSSLAGDSLFNRMSVVASSGKGALESSAAAAGIIAMNDGLPSEEMRFQTALDLARRGDPSGAMLVGEVAGSATDPGVKSRARLAAAELNMKSGRDEAAGRDLSGAMAATAGNPERQEYLAVFLKETGKKPDAPAVIVAARGFLSSHPESRFASEVRLKLAESLLASGDAQGARVEFEHLASTGGEGDFGRRALFLAAQSASRSMDPVSIDESLMLLERVAGTGADDPLTWQARLQEGAIKNAQGLPLEALAIYDKILSSQGPDAELRAAARMARGDTLHQMGAKDPDKEREAIKAWGLIASDPGFGARWRNQALCKSGLVLEKLGEGDAALASYYEAFKSNRDSEQLWHDKAAFEAARLLESRRQWKDAVSLYGQISSEGGARAEEAKARLSRLKLENFLWEN